MVVIDYGETLGKLFDRVLVPFAVRDELLHPRAPQKVKHWILSPPPWLETVPVRNPQPMHGLHKGETEALHLALDRRADAILMDDMDGRAAARRLGIPTIFTIAILELADEKSLLEPPTAIAKPKQTSFFISQEILDAALERDKKRREKKG